MSESLIKQKKCKRCGNEFHPSHGKQILCVKCQDTQIQTKPAPLPGLKKFSNIVNSKKHKWKNIDYK